MSYYQADANPSEYLADVERRINEGSWISRFANRATMIFGGEAGAVSHAAQRQAYWEKYGT